MHLLPNESVDLDQLIKQAKAEYLKIELRERRWASVIRPAIIIGVLSGLITYATTDEHVVAGVLLATVGAFLVALFALEFVHRGNFDKDSYKFLCGIRDQVDVILLRQQNKVLDELSGVAYTNTTHFLCQCMAEDLMPREETLATQMNASAVKGKVLKAWEAHRRNVMDSISKKMVLRNS